jgi:tRNA(Ile)-lysidine synthetase-like protein
MACRCWSTRPGSCARSSAVHMPVTNLVSRIRAEVARAIADQAGAGLVLGFSGGADSTCLADALHTLGARLILAHLNHRLRGADADADAEHVRAFAAARGLPCVIDVIDVRAAAERGNQSIELAAREQRYAFLASVADGQPGACVVTGHHADDQAETVLLRIVRGTGVEGLRAMQRVAPVPGAAHLNVLRPLLRVTRDEIERYCADIGLSFRNDASNAQLDATRNRVRLELLPLLEQLNPGVRRVLARLADTAGAAHEIERYAVESAMTTCAVVHEDAIHLERAAWAALPAGLQRLVLRECVRTLRGADGVTNLNYAALEEARDVMLGAAHSAEIALMADVRAVVDRQRIDIRRVTQF